MGNTFGEEKEIQNIGGYGYMGGGAFGGIFAMIILVVVVLWLLFRDGNKEYGHGYGSVPYPVYPQQNCGICVKDESNWEEDRHLSDLACANTEKIMAQAAAIDQRNQDRQYDALLAKLVEKDNIINTMALKSDFSKEISCLYGAMEKGFCKTDREIDRLACETPKRPPFYACGGEPEVYPYPPRRGRCGDECFA